MYPTEKEASQIRRITDALIAQTGLVPAAVRSVSTDAVRPQIDFGSGTANLSESDCASWLQSGLRSGRLPFVVSISDTEAFLFDEEGVIALGHAYLWKGLKRVKRLSLDGIEPTTNPAS